MSSAPSPLSYVYDGRECLGFILARGKLMPDGRLSDVINLTRARDALAEIRGRP